MSMHPRYEICMLFLSPTRQLEYAHSACNIALALDSRLYTTYSISWELRGIFFFFLQPIHLRLGYTEKSSLG